ncbi:MAG: carboxypeptidase regulatory-like domain-containing protein [Rhodospirillaceae bacterium]|nr:carboxypeptidase regulatory-like domain-containing protein [Rhodospirillaceae bacterium]
MARYSGVGVAAACLFFTYALSTPPAHANGDAFFDDNGAPRETELVYFGSVKDERGDYIAGAIVRAVLALQMESGMRHLTYDATTNVIGRYRTANLGRTIIGFGTDIDPETVTLTAHKEGYRQVRRFYRSRRDQKASIEVNFVMVKE